MGNKKKQDTNRNKLGSLKPRSLNSLHFDCFRVSPSVFVRDQIKRKARFLKRSHWTGNRERQNHQSRENPAQKNTKQTHVDDPASPFSNTLFTFLELLNFTINAQQTKSQFHKRNGKNTFFYRFLMSEFKILKIIRSVDQTFRCHTFLINIFTFSIFFLIPSMFLVCLIFAVAVFTNICHFFILVFFRYSVNINKNSKYLEK